MKNKMLACLLYAVLIWPVALGFRLSATPLPGRAIEPFADAPLCPDALPPLHDLALWHGVWDAARGCHYNHTHGSDPALVNDVFGPAGEWFGGRGPFDYPWNTGIGEQTTKHADYAIFVYADLPCIRAVCITDIRAVVHVEPTSDRVEGLCIGAACHSHSTAVEVRVCKPGAGWCGILQTGGHIVGGQIEVPGGNGNRYCVSTTTGEIVGVNTLCSTSSRWVVPGPLSESSAHVWYCGQPSPAGLPRPILQQVTTTIADAWGWTDYQNIYQPHLYGQARPGNNGATRELHILSIYIPPVDQTPGDGLVNFRGYFDTAGHKSESCQAPGPNCVPTYIGGIQAGVVPQFRPAYYSPKIPKFVFDAEVPEGQSWIEYPYN